MKTRLSRRQTAKVSDSRWLAYSTAGIATALAGSHSAEAAIHYSGRLEVVFPRHATMTMAFQLDQPGDSIWFRHLSSTYYGGASFNVFGIVSEAFRGSVSDAFYVSKLSFGQKIPARGFVSPSPSYVPKLASIGGAGQWNDPGVGFIGFRFNSGAGVQYGWARVRMGGHNKQNGFKLIDYAYADPGQAIRAGEDGIRTGADGQNMSDEQGPDQGSLGWLATGAVGLLAWRKSRSRTTRNA